MSRRLALLLLAILTASVVWAAPPQGAVNSYRRALELKRTGKPLEAAMALQAAIRAYPKYMEAHYALGWVYRQLGKGDKAIESFREVIRLAPRSTEAVEAARAIQRIRLGADSAPARADRIVFVSEREGVVDLYQIEPLTGAARRLTADAAVESDPRWSPDGRFIAFASDAGGNQDIWVMAPDGSALRRLTYDPAPDAHPVWMRDGSAILFETTRGGSRDVFRMAADGSGQRPLVAWPSDERLGGYSPDGKTLAILSDRDGANRVYLLNAQGSEPRRLLPSDVPQGRPVWDPSGRWLYFAWRLERNLQVCRAALDGTHLAAVTRSPYNDDLCDVSPDGRRLLVATDRHGGRELDLVDLGDASRRRLTLNPGDDREASFAP